MADKGFDDISDSTDWLSTPLPGLAAVEAALRCEICKDFYNTPMLTSCNHTFCSMCIRRALANDAKCSLCRSVQESSKLRSNWSMEEAVKAFVATRAQILDLARKPPTVVVQTVEVAVSSPKHALDEGDDAEADQPAKRLRSSARKSKTRGAELTAEMARQEATLAAPSHAHPDYTYNDGLVACPICLERMKEVQVDRHLDSDCPGSPQPQRPQPPKQKSSIGQRNGFPVSSGPAAAQPRPERLGTLSYSMLKDAQLRKKLADLGIPTNGSRPILEKRHQEWVTIWNANCDSLHPKRKPELLQELDVWERTLGSRAPTSSRSINLGAQIKDKEFDHAAWSAKHDSSFQDLVANARRTRAQALKKANPDPEPENLAAAGTQPPSTDATTAPMATSPSSMQIDQPALSLDPSVPAHNNPAPRPFEASGLPPLEATTVDRSRNGPSQMPEPS